MRLLRIPFYALAALLVFVLATSVTIRVLLLDETTVSCPDLTGLDVEQAKKVAAQKGLVLVIGKYEKRKDVPHNCVIYQTPDAAMPVRAGRTVTVALSDGPMLTAIPVFVGLSLEEARAVMQQQGMKLKKAIYVPSAQENRVLAQVPASGDNILDEEGVVLIVGGPAKQFYVMPDIVAGDYAQVVDEMEKKHIRYAVTGGPPSGGKGQTLQTSIPPRTIFSGDDVLELQLTGGGEK